MSKRLSNEGYYSASNLEKMFDLGVSKTSLLNYEEKGLIPTAQRLIKGKSAYRAWHLLELLRVGEVIGYVRRPKRPKVISVFSLKGGTGKTSFAFQLARICALHNIRVLVIGLDAQESITQTLNRTKADAQREVDPEGLVQILTNKIEAEKCILKTDLPTLDYIPENIELSVLDRFLKNKMRKEYIIGEKIVSPLIKTGKYDLVIFDCNPAWTDTVTSALAATDILISPLGCDINSLKAANIFVSLLAEFQDEMRHEFERFFIVPTLSETNKLSQQILAKYRLQFDELCTAASIRRSVTVQESNVLGRSLLETAFTSPVYQDFVGVLREINEIFTEVSPLQQTIVTPPENLLIASDLPFGEVTHGA